MICYFKKVDRNSKYFIKAVYTELFVCLMFVLIVLIKTMVYVGIWSFVI